MTIKTFNKLCTDTKIEYVVFNDDTFLYDFTVNYLEKDEALNETIGMRNDLEKDKATVKYITFNRVKKCVSVTVNVISQC